MSKLLEDKELATTALTHMWKTRVFEEAVDDLFARGLMHGTMHLSIGQEAVASGACLALTIEDQITSTHRGHGHCISKGADINLMMAELLAKENGYCKGRGGSMHIADMATGNLGANGIVAGGTTIAAGAALSNKMQGNDKVALCFHGDGSVGEGAWHEALTLASMWSLPVIFLCENNKYGMSMNSEYAYKVENISEKAAGFGIPGITVDGNDVKAVYEAVTEAVARARRGEGPTLIEAKTYRWKGHSKSDKNLYRTKEEIESWRQKDPVARYSHELLEAGLFTQDELNGIQDEARTAIKEAVKFGMKGEDPKVEEILKGVYAFSPVDMHDLEAEGVKA
ncbi:MAG: thiamine pyrophosphate-dependent dehydrogenase E1 component subunit alpha [Microbacteriaceae bacterium]